MEKVCDCGVPVKAIDIIIDSDLTLYSDGTTESALRHPDGAGFIGTGLVYCPRCKDLFFIKDGTPQFETDFVIVKVEEEIPGIEVVIRKIGSGQQRLPESDHACSIIDERSQK